MKIKAERNHQPPVQIRIPEPRYCCDGEDCPSPGHVHRAEELHYHDKTLVPGFFCQTCLPKPLMFENPDIAPEPRSLAEITAAQQRKPGDPIHGKNGATPEEMKRKEATLDELLEVAEKAAGPESFLKGVRKMARRAREHRKEGAV